MKLDALKDYIRDNDLQKSVPRYTKIRKAEIIARLVELHQLNEEEPEPVPNIQPDNEPEPITEPEPVPNIQPDTIEPISEEEADEILYDAKELFMKGFYQGELYMMLEQYNIIADMYFNSTNKKIKIKPTIQFMLIKDALIRYPAWDTTFKPALLSLIEQNNYMPHLFKD